MSYKAYLDGDEQDRCDHAEAYIAELEEEVERLRRWQCASCGVLTSNDAQGREFIARTK